MNFLRCQVYGYLSGLCGLLIGFSNGAIAQMPPPPPSPPLPPSPAPPSPPLASLPTDIIPDTTLLIDSNVRNSNMGEPLGSIIIDQGTLSGNNLFHSFETFNILSGQTVFFDPQGASRIISRVTGSGATLINGQLGVLNNANSEVIFINPNGISFGSDANLILTGDFTASTASAVLFKDGSFFNAKDQTLPLLTVTAPIGLQFGENPQAIAFNNSTNIQLDPSQKLMLSGGGITFTDSQINATASNMSFISVGSAGQIFLTADGDPTIQSAAALNNVFDPAIARGNITIDNSTINSSNGGEIAMAGNELRLKNAANIATPVSSGASGGDILLNFQHIQLTDNSRIDLVVRRGSGLGGKLDLQTNSLDINSSQITADTFADGNAGIIQINATDYVRLVATANNQNPSGIGSGARPPQRPRQSAGTGNGGGINITTKDLFLLDGAQINASTDSFGHGGDITIDASGNVLLTTTSAIQPSTIQALSGVLAKGEGGKIKITAASLSVLNGSQISATTQSAQRGGDINIDVSGITRLEGAITALDPNNLPSTKYNSVYFNQNVVPSGIFTSSQGQGDAGFIELKTGELSVKDKGQISVSSRQSGGAGNLTINSDRLFLSGATLLAETVAGDNANIFLNIAEYLFLDQQSLISTNATKNATGGNLEINTQFLFARNNSDITANSQNSFGGRVIVTATGIYGTDFRDFLTVDSDITASSRLGAEFSGEVILNTPEVDPTSSLTKLPENLSDPNDQISTECDSSKTNKFTVIGRGGIPPTPQSITDDGIWTDWRRSNSPVATTTNSRNITPVSTIVQAQGWQKKADGTVQLLANQDDTLNRRSPKLIPDLNCQQINQS